MMASICLSDFQMKYQGHKRQLAICQTQKPNSSKSILNHRGLSNIWLEQTTHSKKWLKAKIKLTLTDQFKQNWQSTVQSSPNAMNYCMY